MHRVTWGKQWRTRYTGTERLFDELPNNEPYRAEMWSLHAMNSLPGRAATAIVLGGTLVIRSAYLLLGPADFADRDSYGYLARKLIEDGSYARQHNPTAFRPPLYPITLAAVFATQRLLGAEPESTFGIALLHLALGMATVYLTLRLGRCLGLATPAYLSAVLIAVDPLLIFHSGLMMTETLFALLLVALMVVLAAGGNSARLLRHTGRRSLAAGTIFGLAALCRPSIWPFLPVAIICCATLPPAQSGQTHTHMRLRAIALFLLGLSVMVLPWTARNAIVLGRPVATTTHGGETFWRANNRWLFDACIRDGNPHWEDRSGWERRRRQITGGKTEIAADRACYAEAWDTIRQRPADFAKAVAQRVFTLWRPWPQQSVYGKAPAITIGIFYFCELALAGIGLCNRNVWRHPWVLLPALLASVTVVHSLYWTDLRMRAPLMPAVALLATAGFRTVQSGLRMQKKHERMRGD